MIKKDKHKPGWFMKCASPLNDADSFFIYLPKTQLDIVDEKTQPSFTFCLSKNDRNTAQLRTSLF